MKLLELFVDFVARGHEELKGQIGDIREDTVRMLIEFQKAEKEEKRVANERRKRTQEQARLNKTVNDGFKATVTAVTTAVNRMNIAITGSTLAWTTMGFVGTTHGGALQEQMARLSRGIASVFIPDMEKLIAVVRKAGDWFQNLSGEQQASIAHTVKTAIVFLTLSGVLIKVVPVLISVYKWFKAVAVAQLGMQAIMAGPIAGVAVFAAGLGILAASSAIAETGLDKLGDAFDTTGMKAKKSYATIAAAMDDARDSISGWEKAWGVIRAGAWVGGSLATGGLLAAMVDPPNFQQMVKSRAKGLFEAGKPSAKGRNDVQLANSGTEAITATIQRLQDAALKQDYLRDSAENLRKIRELMEQFMNSPGQSNPANSIVRALMASG